MKIRKTGMEIISAEASLASAFEALLPRPM
jgi:hypothetical protein